MTDLKHPLLRQCQALRRTIDSCGVSVELTEAAARASELMLDLELFLLTPVNPPATLPVLYTCIGKGGTYELLGECIGAGSNKGHNTLVYRNIYTGQLFSRLLDDFETRMQRLPGVPERV